MSLSDSGGTAPVEDAFGALHRWPCLCGGASSGSQAAVGSNGERHTFFKNGELGSYNECPKRIMEAICPDMYIYIYNMYMCLSLNL